MTDIKTSDVLRNRSLVLFLIARISTAISFQMLSIAVGWQMYALTNDPFWLGMVGLVQFLPMFLLTLAVGHVADRFDRRRIIGASQIVTATGVFLLAAGTMQGWLSKESILAILLFISAANAFSNPSMQALMPNLVEKEQFPRAATVSASAFQFAVIVGPSLGGLLYAISPVVVYVLGGTLSLTASLLVNLVQLKTQQARPGPATLKSLFAGITFIWSKPVILGAISLDMFAVLFGGATALLPAYAAHILIVGPVGLGILRAAPAVGALLTSLFLARRPLERHVGRAMFIAVIVFGLATLGFSISKSFAVSLAMLFVLGAADVVSVVIRSTLVQLETPDEMRGRVSSVNTMFIGTSNQLGEFESGVTASWWGIVPAVFVGGLGTIAVALAWTRLFPAIWRIDRFGKREG